MRGIRLACVLVTLPLLRAAHAATIVVPPGPGTPVQDAIDAAQPGDTVRLQRGAYPEHVVIAKPLKLRGAGSRARQLADTTHLEGGCTGQPVITVAADGVTIRDVAIGTVAAGAVDVQGRTRIVLSRLYAVSNCAVVTAPAYNVANSSRVKLDNVWGTGFASPVRGPAGIRIADTTDGPIAVRRSVSGYFDVGVLVENVAGKAIRVSGNDVNFNDVGIRLSGATGVLVDHNRLVDDTTLGIHVDAASSGNLLVGNRIEGSATDVQDDGTGNCWRANVFTTGSVPACP